MISLKFIHAADLHLDSPFTGLRIVNPELARAAQNATFEAFEALVDHAISKKVDFFLVAGDVYDSADRSLRAQLRFCRALDRLADQGIPTFVVHGNHDPLDGWSAHLAWPQLVTIFPGDKVSSVPVVKEGREAARIWGKSYPTREVRKNLVPEFSRDEKTPFAVGLLHCNLGTNTGHEPYAPCSLKDLEKGGFDYWALGHVHKKALREIGDRSLAVYPGNIQGRHPGESGPHGAILVSVENSGKIETEFLPVDNLRWESTELNIAGISGEGELISALENRIAELEDEAGGRHLCLRIALTGRGELHSTLSRRGFIAELETDLRERWAGAGTLVWIERCENRTLPLVDLEKRRRADDFLAGLLEEFDELRVTLKEDKEKLLEILADLYQDSRARRFLAEPDEKELPELIESAQTLCIDRLAGEGEED